MRGFPDRAVPGLVTCAVSGLAVPGRVAKVLALSGRAVPGRFTAAVPGLIAVDRAVPGRVTPAVPGLRCAVVGLEAMSAIIRVALESHSNDALLVFRCLVRALVGRLLTHVLSSLLSCPFYASIVAISRSDKT